MTEEPSSGKQLGGEHAARQWWRPALLGHERCLGTVPSWVRLAESAIALADALPGQLPTQAHISSPVNSTTVGTFEMRREDAEALFTPVIAPFVILALEPVRSLVASRPQLSGVTVGVAERELSALLCRVIARVMVSEVERLAGPATDVSDSQARFQAVITATASSAGLTALLTRYPVLARLLAGLASQRADALLELLVRFDADRPAIVDHLLSGLDPGPLRKVSMGAGDSHRKGRSVSMLWFEDGQAVVYKPRPLTVHRAFDQILDIIGQQSPDIVPRPARVLTRVDYGWMEAVPHLPCLTAEDVGDFYRRLGVLLAVAHVLRATDLHCQNVIASGAQPVIIDLETVLHPDRDWGMGAIADPARASVTRSVLRTSMLPWQNSGPDLSAFGGDEASINDFVRYDDAGLATMRLRRGRGRFGGASNRPLLNGLPGRATEHLPAILDGFRTAYDTLTRQRALLLAPGGVLDELSQQRGRVVLRDTSTYVHLLDECTHPSVLGSAAARQEMLRRLAGQNRPTEQTALESEIEQLWLGDVPVFETHPGRDGIFAVDTDRQVSIRCDARSSAHQVACGLSLMDRDNQSWIIAAALATRASESKPTDVSIALRLENRHEEGITALSAALAVADRIIAGAVDDGRRCNWMSLYRHPDATSSVLPMGADLANGYTGVALFLAQVAAMTARERHHDFATRAVLDLPELIERLAGNPAWARAVGAGALHGVGGIGYAITRLVALIPDSNLDQSIDAAVRLIRHACDAPDLTVATGRAGGLLALLAMDTDGYSAARVAAREVAYELDRELDGPAAPTHTGGVLRGQLGVIWALARAGRQLGVPELATRARHMMAPLSTADWDWLPLGFAGGLAGLSLATAEVEPDGFAARRLRGALHSCLARPGLPDDSLATGEAGLLDVSLRMSPDRSGASAGGVATSTLRARRAARLASAVSAGCLGVRCSTPIAIPSPGLLYGLAGVGLGLLRIHDPQSVPSVLAWDSIAAPAGSSS